jgi:hypothetical protein
MGLINLHISRALYSDSVNEKKSSEKRRQLLNLMKYRLGSVKYPRWLIKVLHKLLFNPKRFLFSERIFFLGRVTTQI